MKTNVRYIALMTVMAVCGCLQLAAQKQRSEQFRDKYQLQEVVALSRHNVRAPLSDASSPVGRLTPHKWIEWTAPKSELTLHGGVLETMMGQYFRKWLEDAGMFPENCVPTTDDVNITANSMQRCIATAQYFTAGFMPTAGLRINHRFTPSRMDPLFLPQLTKAGQAYEALVMEQINEATGGKGLEGFSRSLQPDFELIAEVLDAIDSPMMKSDSPDKQILANHSPQPRFDLFAEPGLLGGSALQLFGSASDALSLQYYEQPDSLAASFGHPLTHEQWKRIAGVKDAYMELLFDVPAVGVNVARPLIQYIYDELRAPTRRFTLLVGHDSNLAFVSSALGIEPYELPGSIEKRTPIGSKIVFEKFVDADGGEWADVNIVYQSADQLRHTTPLTLDTPPMIYQLSLRGLERNADGLYPMADLLKRFHDTLHAYDELPSE